MCSKTYMCGLMAVLPQVADIKTHKCANITACCKLKVASISAKIVMYVNVHIQQYAINVIR